MIPKDLQRLQLWIRIHNRIVVDMLRKTPEKEWWSKSYLHGARNMLRMLSRQWAYDVKQRRRDEEAHRN